ncbi:Retrovirus-related Pol polyprotein from transposon TNT 1-94 [Vitis vinifera]|uniref:Retrovirus-related Pol polyprotein from transposon TNT 1-94 n=1 Tax=Vitis vinifera TaxID=29760 RepID=A0A438G561_VITVI|nr:Retrovirus-related Pol polyprotein from transposon TNT 1-94 [Vitis vinifera]
MQPANFSNIKCDIPELKGDNYKVWNERILLHLGCMNIDYAIRKDKLTIIDTNTTAEKVLYEQWQRSNRLSLMFIKTKISDGICGSVDQHDNVKALLKAIDEQFVTSDKELASTLIMKFSSLRLTNVSGVREHIMQMRDIAAQLKTLEVEMSDSFIVHFILNTLPQQYGPFKISYDTHKDKWSINELLTMCVQEEERLKMELGENALMTMEGKDQNQAKKKGKGKIPPKVESRRSIGYAKPKEANANLFYKSNLVGNGTLSNGLFSINLQNDTTNNTMHVHIGTKRCVMNEDSSMLWHRRLGHISIQRIKRLVNDGVLSTLDFTDFHTCVDCIKGKQTNKSKKGAKRSTDILEIIHSDICCPSMDAYGPKYFISFIDDYSRYMYVYLLHNKNEALGAFKVFKAEVEKQCGKQIKIVRTDRGGEYYGRYTEDGQAPGPFVKFLQEHGIVAQYTMPGSPDQNGVTERRNRNINGHVPTKVVPKTPFELWKGWKSSLRHICIWGCPSEVRVYNPQEKKLDPRTFSAYFIGYAEGSKGYRFYYPSHNIRIVELRNAKFLENDLISGSDRFQDIVSEKDHIDAQPSTFIEAPQIANDNPVDQVVQDLPKIVEQPVEQQLDYDIGAENDPETFSQAISCKESNLWYDAMKDEMNSMASNGVWNLVELPNGAKAIGCKWVFKTKKDSLGNIERYKERLVAKGFTQNEGIDYKKTFSPVSKKDSLRVIMTLVAHFDLELQQIDVKMTFLNGNLEEEVYMKQLEGFSSNGGEHLVCKLKKSIYGLKQASRQWYLKFHDVISSFGFVENIMDQCIYQKVSGSKICFLVLYVDDILLATNDKGLLHEVKQFLSKNFDMKDMGDATYVIGIKIQRDRFRGLLGLSQETYINKVLERFRMKDCSPSIAPIVKGDRFNLNQCPKNDLEREQMKNIPYASAVGSLMYVQVCTRPDIAFAVGMLGRYQSNQGYVFMLAVGTVSWRSAKQTLIATSTMEVEFVSCFEATSHGVWLKSFISGLRVMDSISRPLKIYCDNSAVIFMAKNNKSSSRNKHIDIKYLALRERVKEKTVVIEHVSTELMIVDPLTKGMPPLKFKDHVDRLGLGSFV